MNRNVTVGVIAVLALAVLAFLLTQQRPAQPQAPTIVTSPSPQATPTEATPSPTIEKVVNITSTGFNPPNITIKAGESVTWINQDTTPHQINSAVHPTHLLYPPLNTVGLLKPAEQKSLTLPTAGTYKYHNHLNPSLTGAVTVE